MINWLKDTFRTTPSKKDLFEEILAMQTEIIVLKRHLEFNDDVNEKLATRLYLLEHKVGKKKKK